MTPLYDAAETLLHELDSAYHGCAAASDCPICTATAKFRKVLYATPSGLGEHSPHDALLLWTHPAPDAAAPAQISPSKTMTVGYQQTPLPAERDERAAFEAAFRTYFGSEPQPGFDQPADFWLERIDDGRYATTRVDDAWTGWKAAIASQGRGA